MEVRAQPAVGDVVAGRPTLVERVGTGATAAVWRAEDSLEPHVAAGPVADVAAGLDLRRFAGTSTSGHTMLLPMIAPEPHGDESGIYDRRALVAGAPAPATGLDRGDR